MVKLQKKAGLAEEASWCHVAARWELKALRMLLIRPNDWNRWDSSTIRRFAGQLELFSFEVRQAMEINSHENLTVAKLSAGRL